MIINYLDNKLHLQRSYTNISEVLWDEVDFIYFFFKIYILNKILFLSKIKAKLTEKIQELKEVLSEEEMKKVHDGTFDYTKIYKQIMPFDPTFLQSEILE